MAVVSSIVRNNVLGKIAITVPTFATLTLLYEAGDGSLGSLDKHLNERQRFQRRGNHVSTGWGARIYPAFAFSSYWTELIGSDDTAPGSLAEALFQIGAYDDSGSLIPPTCTIDWTVYGQGVGLATDEVITMTSVSAQINLAEAVDGNKIDVAGMVEGSVTITRGAKSETFAEIAAS